MKRIKGFRAFKPISKISAVLRLLNRRYQYQSWTPKYKSFIKMIREKWCR
ncbi:hypothetical protein CHCC20335_2568 [Bacillus paralicheniformis]|nr:hypothetical protein CHCC20335_2568 [Bacillus paralicheniformis]